MATFNKHGLSRTIPESVKLEVRQRCGFGCVVCASPIVEYEHVIPTYSEARTHSPDAITLLCPTCHAKVTKRLYSKEKIIKAMQSPAALQKGKVADILDFSDRHPTIIFGGATFEACSVPIMFKNEPLLKIEKESDAFLISGRFYDSQGVVNLELLKNEWICSAKHWDVQVIGPRISIIEKKRGPRLIIKVDAPEKLIVERLDMLIKGTRIVGDEHKLRVGPHLFQNCAASNCEIGFCFG
ncbi:HNH endonuclease [Citrobacter freundii]|nr:HNH endonuclease [Citrobacter freundii]HDX4555983.1 HNH endonuclease [Citrobacter freundii]